VCIVIFSGRELAWLLTGSIDHQQNSRSKHARHRTDDALYEALGQVHAVRFRMLTDAALRLEFDELLHQHAGGKPKNKILFLVKLAFFPDTLQPGPGRKADLNKASRYVKLINHALAKDIEPGKFGAFAREHGIQRTALAAGRTALSW